MNILIGFFYFILFFILTRKLLGEIWFVDGGLCFVFRGGEGGGGGKDLVLVYLLYLLFQYTYSVLPFHLNVKISTLDFYYGNSVNIQKKKSKAVKHDQLMSL